EPLDLLGREGFPPCLYERRTARRAYAVKDGSRGHRVCVLAGLQGEVMEPGHGEPAFHIAHIEVEHRMVGWPPAAEIRDHATLRVAEVEQRPDVRVPAVVRRAE